MIEDFSKRTEPEAQKYAEEKQGAVYMTNSLVDEKKLQEHLSKYTTIASINSLLQVGIFIYASINIDETNMGSQQSGFWRSWYFPSQVKTDISGCE